MDLNPDALYQCLRADLAQYLSWDDISFLEDHPVWPDASTTEAACSSILKSFYKKYLKGFNEETRARAYAKFLAINSRCQEWSLHLRNSREEALYGEFRRAIYEFFTPDGFDLLDDESDALDYGRCGPGASIGARGNDTYSKLFASPLTCTSLSLYHRYRRYVNRYPEWFSAELLRASRHGSASVVVGNRLSFVPKDDKISRSICVEPSLNMFFQLGIGVILERRLKQFYGVDLSDQPEKNRKLARLGSLGWGQVTIDLSSASDSISLKMLEAVLPRGIYKILCRVRSPHTSYDGNQHELYMVSTMGNGFTFPLQTALFSCVVRAAARINDYNIVDPRGDHCGNWGVFGDDIICNRKIAGDVLRLLDILGFTVNPDKTFVEGPFRESCGADFFKGIDIRGVYVKRLTTVQDRYAVINQLNLFSTRTGINLPTAVQYLSKTVRWLPVPPACDDSSGIKVPESLVHNLPLSISTHSRLYVYYEAIGVKIRIMDSVIKVPSGSKKLDYNPSGLWISFLWRLVNASSIGVRHDPVRWRRKRVCTPYWDYKPTIHRLRWFNWQRWETAVYLNLFG